MNSLFRFSTFATLAFLTVCFLYALPVHAAPSSLEDFCSANPCRKDLTIRLRTESKDLNIPVPLYWPAVQGEQLSILPGEKLYIEAQVDGRSLTNLNQVDSITNPENTLVFEFTQMDKETGMMLTVKNPFTARLKYHINMVDFAHKPYQTSSCAVMAGGSVSEMWSHPITELLISDFHFPENPVGCVY